MYGSLDESGVQFGVDRCLEERLHELAARRGPEAVHFCLLELPDDEPHQLVARHLLVRLDQVARVDQHELLVVEARQQSFRVCRMQVLVGVRGGVLAELPHAVKDRLGYYAVVLLLVLGFQAIVLADIHILYICLDICNMFYFLASHDALIAVCTRNKTVQTLS